MGKLLCSDPLSVQNPVGELIPQVPQRPEEGSKIPSSVRREHTGDVFPYNPSRPVTPSDVNIVKHESASGVVEAFPEPGD